LQLETLGVSVFLNFMLRRKIAPGIAMTNVRFGSKADIGACLRDVRFTPKKQTFVAATGMSALP
jgi:hypothetical protein